MKMLNKRLFRDYQSNYMENFLHKPLQKGDSKPFYSYLKKIRNAGNTIAEIMDEDGVLVKEDLKMANILNRFFNSVFTSLENVGTEDHVVTKSENTDLFHIDCKGVEKLLGDLKPHKAPGPDGLGKTILTIVPEVTFY